MMKNIDADYYGYRDDDDGILIPLEKARSEQLEKEAMEKWLSNKGNDANLGKEEEDIYAVQEEPVSDDETSIDDLSDEAGQPRFIAHVPVPTQQQIEDALIKKKKEELMQLYASSDIIKAVEETKALIG
ncbi:Pre-mRNA-splicing factor ISY1-like protein, partial [Stegodyphus mimosarum]